MIIVTGPNLRSGSVLCVTFVCGVGEPELIGVGAGLDDMGAEGEPVNDGGEPGIGEGLTPFREGRVGGDGDEGAFLAHG